MKATTTTRRLFIAAGPAATVFASLGAAAASAQPSDDLRRAIEAHKAARVAIDAHSGPEDLPLELIQAEDDALEAIALVPCDDAAFMDKLRYLLAVHKRDFGSMWETQECPALMAAIDAHLGGGKAI